ncbi:hypothetical protein ACVJ1F_001260 [Frigoribacterium sp. 2355]
MRHVGPAAGGFVLPARGVVPETDATRLARS